MTTTRSPRNGSPVAVPITESSPPPSPATTAAKTAKPSVQSGVSLLSTPAVSKRSNDHISTAYGFPSTPVNMVMTPSIADTPCITPMPSHDSDVQGGTDTQDELDIMLCHEDFPKLLSLASQVKSLHFHGSVTTPQANGKDGPLEASEVLAAVTRLQERLLSTSSNSQSELYVAPSKIGRGVCPMTDSLFDDSFTILEQELDRCQQLAASEPKTMVSMPKKKKSSNKSQKEAIAIKYSKWQTDILMQWMIEHIDNPFPDPDEVHELMHKTNLSYSQVINWTTNVRKRNRKATCEEKKKPHHFIDFLFLAQKRDSDKEEQSLSSHPVPATPSRGTHNEGDSTPILPPSQKKRKLDYSLPPLRPGETTPTSAAARTPSRPRYPGTPSQHHGAPYSPYVYHPEYGYTMAFPTSPAYFYGHSPYHGDPRAQHASPHHHPYYHHGPPSPSPHHAARPGPGNGQPPARNYQRHPPSRPPTPVGSDSRLQSIHEEEAQQSPVAKAQVSGAVPDKSPASKTSPVKIKEESGTDIPVPTDGQQLPPSGNVAIKQEPTSPSNSYDGNIQIKPDLVLSAPVKQEAGAVPVSFDDGTAMDPIDIDEPLDNSLLQDFAMFWEINLEDDSDDDGNVDARSHPIFVLRSGSGEVPDLMDEEQQTSTTPMPDEHRSSNAMEVDEVPSDMAIGA